MLVFLFLSLFITSSAVVQSFEFVVNETGGMCEGKIERSFLHCEGSPPVDYSPVTDDPLTECGNVCLNTQDGNGDPCVAFTYRNNAYQLDPTKQNTCELDFCSVSTPTTAIGVESYILWPICFESETPTQTPSSKPSLRPTVAPSSKPSLRPTVTPSSKPSLRPTVTLTAQSTQTSTPSLSPGSPTQSPSFVSPSGIPPFAPFDSSLFTQYAGDPVLCDVYELQPGTLSVVYTDFGGTSDECMKECQYDSFCVGVLYSATLNTCTKSTALQKTDDYFAIADFLANWMAYIRTDYVIPYYAGYCSQWRSPVYCTAETSDGQCAWDVGEQGYNQMYFTDPGYCGRIACYN